MFKLDKNYFKLFNLPEEFKLDIRRLEYSYYSMQRDNHPDIFLENYKKKIAFERLSFINKAYINLKYPLKRGKYLLLLRNINISNITIVNDEFILNKIKQQERFYNILKKKNLIKLNSLLFELLIEKKKNFLKLEYFFRKNLNNKALYIINKLVFIEKIIMKIYIEIDKIENEY